MIAETPPSIDNEAELRELAHCWAEAVHTKNLATLQKFYAPDVVLYDAAPPLASEGVMTLARNMAEWFATWPGLIGLELGELQVQVSGDVAFSHCLYHLTGQRTGESDTDVWMRMTLGWRKLNGAWRIVHEHSSAPFHMKPPYKATLHLKP